MERSKKVINAIDLLRTQQLFRTQKLINQIKKRYGNK